MFKYNLISVMLKLTPQLGDSGTLSTTVLKVDPLLPAIVEYTNKVCYLCKRDQPLDNFTLRNVQSLIIGSPIYSTKCNSCTKLLESTLNYKSMRNELMNDWSHEPLTDTNSKVCSSCNRRKQLKEFLPVLGWTPVTKDNLGVSKRCGVCIVGEGNNG